MIKYVATEVETTGWCPLKCSYCYIPKTEEMKMLHKKIVGDIRSNKLLQNLKNAPTELEFLAFWGTEPALTISFMADYVKELKKEHDIREISYSTSMILSPEPFIRFFEGINGLGIRKVKHQVSLDGPEWITDVNRAEGATRKVIANLEEMIRELNSISLDFVVEITWKSTLQIENIKRMVEEPWLIHEYFDFFDKLTSRLLRLNKNCNVRILNTSAPTLVVPGKYTSEDGRVLSKFFEYLRSMKYPNTYVNRLLRIWRLRNDFWKPRIFTCSGGDSNMGFDGENIHICHRTFYYERDAYVNSVLKMPEYKNWDVSKFEKGLVSNIRKWYIVDSTDEFNLTRFQYVLRGYHDFWKMKLASTYAMIKELAMAGQASKIYLENDKMAELLALFINTALSCPMENLLNTGSIHVPPISLIRLFGNGAFEILVEEVSRIVKLSGGK